MSRDVFALLRRHRGAILLATSWLAVQRLLMLTVPDARPHTRFVVAAPALRLALWIGLPFVSGVLAPRAWRRSIFVLAVPLVLAFWLLTAPWNGTSDTPPGLQWTEVSLAGATIVVGAQYVAFLLGVASSGLRELAASRHSN